MNASVLLRLLDSGQLSITRGVHAIEAVEGRFRVRTRNDSERATESVVDTAESVGTPESVVDTEYVVNAVNPPPQAVPAAARPLVESLVATGLATLHPSGGLTPADPRVHVVGDLAGGGSFITSGIPGVAAQASRTARALRTP
ncbi:hypothetical protein [Streptomyces sp. NPDC021622]|uniref:hypothetical protein n=1 Tax=Streptomyces sp. NPDC021622 TaxID=3155013 RepID=UPI0034004F39